jgi:CubicO group peptidase (beta-lactamase class C family)
LGQVVQAVTGEDLPTFLTTEVFEPLGLEMLMDPMTEIDGKAVSYSGVAGQWQIADVRWEPTIGAGSIQTTPSELVEWASQYWEPTIGALDDQWRTIRHCDRHSPKRSLRGVQRRDVRNRHGQRHRPGDLAPRWLGRFRTLFSVAPAHRLAIAVSCNSPTSFAKLRTTLDRDLFTAWIGNN